MTNEWITDRQPTKEDEDKSGYVWRKMSPTGQGGLAFASQVGHAIPWRHTDDWEPPAEAPTPAPKPELRVRGGEVVTIGTFNGGNTYPFGGSNGSEYTEGGRYWLKEEEHRADLVDPITDNPSEPCEPTPEPEAPAPAPKPGLKVGQVWKRRTGGSMTVKSVDGDRFRVTDGQGFDWFYRPDGSAFSLSPGLDLTELISDAPVEPTTRKVPRLFAAPPVRTWAPDGMGLIDALATDGTAWYRNLGDPEWVQHQPLPDREEPANA